MEILIKTWEGLQYYLPISDIWNEPEKFYVGKVKVLCDFLRENQWNMTANICAALLIEPINTLYAAYLQNGFGKRNIVNLNPKTLSKEQQKHAPVLLIHGDHSHPDIFGPMIDQIAKENPERAIFTIYLRSDSGIVSEKDHLEQLVDKVQKIYNLYPESPKLTVVGHSSGGDIIEPLAKKMKELKNPLWGKLIAIGSVFKGAITEDFTEIFKEYLAFLGDKDIFEGCQRKVSNSLIVNSGHIGLLFNENVLARVCKEISSNDVPSKNNEI